MTVITVDGYAVDSAGSVGAGVDDFPMSGVDSKTGGGVDTERLQAIWSASMATAAIAILPQAAVMLPFWTSIGSRQIPARSPESYLAQSHTRQRATQPGGRLADRCHA